ncbi:unnamed protein product, partial [marine sediment metagenome]
QCGHRFESFQKMTDEPLEDCPECGGKVRRLIGAGAGIIFKGKGFYTTDHGKTYGRGDGGASCDRETPCCGRGAPCEKSPRNK